MRLEMPDIINRHTGKIAYVVGNGPSAKSTIEHLITSKRNYDENREVVLCCNDIDILLENIGFTLDDLRPNYWVLANPGMTVENYYNRFNAMKTYGGCLLNGDSVVYSTSTNLIDVSDEILEVNFLGYDQRHFEGKTCPDVAPCCIKNMNNIIKGRKTIQETLQEYTGHSMRYGSGSTVAVHMLAFAVIMGCKTIYISGVDLDYNLGYLDRITVNHDRFDIWPDIPVDFSIIGDSAVKVGTKIINLSQTSILRNIFETKEDESST